LCADHIGGEHVGSKLQALEFDVDARGEGLNRKGLGQTRHAFQKHVTIGEQANDQPLHKISLADDDLADFIQQGAHKRARLLHFLIDRANSCIHT